MQHAGRKKNCWQPSVRNISSLNHLSPRRNMRRDEWIMEAEKQHIGWWITSALESNIGLNAIAHWCATFNNPLPQGLGTGMLFTDNIEVPLEIRKRLPVVL